MKTPQVKYGITTQISLIQTPPSLIFYDITSLYYFIYHIEWVTRSKWTLVCCIESFSTNVNPPNFTIFKRGPRYEYTNIRTCEMYTCIGIPKHSKHWRLSWFRYETFITFLTFSLFNTRRERDNFYYVDSFIWPNNTRVSCSP